MPAHAIHHLNWEIGDTGISTPVKPAPSATPLHPGLSASLRLSASQRELLVHDGLSFLVLTLVCIALTVITSFLFQSFQDHRAELAVRWAERGRTALASHKPEEAIDAFRTALSYAPDDRADQLLLAQSLAASPNHIDEASNYFLNLWDQTPGDGFINLQLARLARRKGDDQTAINYYRASIFGNWNADGPARRREVRVELADFLELQHDLTASRAELFIAAANTPQDPRFAMLVADRLARTGDLTDALNYQEKAVALAPHDRDILASAAQTAYKLGQFPLARRLFEHAAEAPAPAGQTLEEMKLNQLHLEVEAQHAQRAIELSLARDLPQPERVAHLLQASEIAQGRLNACVAQIVHQQKPGAPNPPGTANPPSTANPPGTALATAAAAALPLDLVSLKARWPVSPVAAQRTLLNQNVDAQDLRADLIFATEQQTAKSCGAPSGDDAILLLLANLYRPAAGAGNGFNALQAGHGR